MKQNGILKRYPESTNPKAGFFGVFWIFESFRPKIDRESAFYAISNALKT